MAFFTYLRDKHNEWYEPVTIIATIGEMLFILFFIFLFFYLFGIEIHAKGVFLAILLLKQIYELCHDSLKRIVKSKLKFDNK